MSTRPRNVPIWPPDPQKDVDQRWKCTICRRNEDVPSNPNLCETCQPWNDFSHLVFCTQPEGQGVDVRAFDPGVGEREHESFGLQNLIYQPLTLEPQHGNCIICRFIRSQLINRLSESYLEDARFAVCGLFPSKRTDPYYTHLLGNSDAGEPFFERCALAICTSTPSTQSANGWKYRPLVLQVVVQYEDPKGSRLESIQPWDRRYCNIGLLKQWLTDCRTYHGRECNRTLLEAKLPSGFRLIDAPHKRICRPASKVPFVALSYVWKSATAFEERDTRLTRANKMALEEPKSLSRERLPEVVGDAMMLCRNMKQRYLWVDRLCIVQDDAEDKMNQINNMDNIYQLAEFTIVAAADGVGAGLPGLLTRPRPSTLENKSWEFIKYVSKCPSIGANGATSLPIIGVAPQSESRVIDTCEWNTRAWTFQERLLSRRHIFVGSGNVYFSCFHEGSELSRYSEIEKYRRPRRTQPHDAEQLPENWGRGFEKGLRSDEYNGDGVLGLYPVLVSQYTSRILGREEDILNAFAGVGNVIAARAKTKMLLGLPERYLSHCLLWSSNESWGDSSPSTGPLSTSVPTWTWASRQRSILYQRSLGGRSDSAWVDPMYQIHFGHLVGFFYSDPSTTEGQKLRPVSEGRVWFPEDRVDGSGREEDMERDLDCFFDPKENDLHESGYLDPRQEPSWNRITDMWVNCVHGPWEALQHFDLDEMTRSRAEEYPHCLAFNTTVAQLRLGANSNAESTEAQLGIYDDANNMIGITAPIHKDYASKLLIQEMRHYMFVIAAGLRFPGTWEDNPVFAGSHGYGLYVMIASRQDYLYSRLGLGFVSVQGWTSISPTWEPVILT